MKYQPPMRGMSVPAARRENHVNFYNEYLLLLEEHTDEQAGRQRVR
jgi:hypothetical protein